MNSSSLLLLGLLTLTTATQPETSFQIFRKFVSQCLIKTEIYKCIKIQSLKIMNRALHSKAINVMDGITVISERREGKEFQEPLNETELETLPSEEIDGKLLNTTSEFFDTHKFQISFPKLLEQGRKKSSMKGSGWQALLWALAIKGTMVSMAYQGIAVMSGTALIVGKLAILLAAILGLKKLVSSEHEKTTVEIVKVPKYSESHSHSVSFDDDHHHIHRSIDEFGKRIENRQL